MFESQNQELFDLLEEGFNWDLCMTVNTYGYRMMMRALEMAECCKIIQNTLFPNSCANQTNLFPALKFSNKAIAENPAQNLAVKAIVSKRSGLAPLCLSYLYMFLMFNF